MKKAWIFLAVAGLIVLVYSNYQPNSILTVSAGKLFLPTQPIAKEASLMFVGDMMFDRYIRQVGQKAGADYTLACVKDFLKEADLVIGNLEGPITEKPSISLGSVVDSPENYVFTFPPNTAQILAEANIRLVNLGNNHIANFGQEGIDSTKKYLAQAGVDHFGPDIFRTKIKGYDFSFISYNEFNGESREAVATKIKSEKMAGQIVLVYTHWGDEYVAPPPRVKTTAKIFAESGADLIIGSHPHIILEKEKIGDTIVYYSLGNFIFDQYWNQEVSTGLLLELKIKGNEPADWQIIEHRATLDRNGQTCLEK